MDNKKYIYLKKYIYVKEIIKKQKETIEKEKIPPQLVAVQPFQFFFEVRVERKIKPIISELMLAVNGLISESI